MHLLWMKVVPSLTAALLAPTSRNPRLLGRRRYRQWPRRCRRIWARRRLERQGGRGGGAGGGKDASEVGDEALKEERAPVRTGRRAWQWLARHGGGEEDTA
ncbi:hypothetical protein E2562_003134 [Oryza meyeriana var. granulata]|uniref:DUF834 domain-containing protein n=1 Tax=Oryza meyeriana var. granulata TaxID=110450 RepID=A0A6G1EA62_9ORYZ|nr:hypothetical protein E2562_003134 [Oryza meyeriana var. granulata]